MRHPAAIIVVLALAYASACGGGHDDGGESGAPGNLDHGFGDGGIASTALGDYAFLNALAAAPGGDVIAAGSAAPVRFGPIHFALARYRPDGRLDATFGDHGTVITEIGNASTIVDVAVQSGGGIVVAGSSSIDFDPARLTIGRYRSDGRLDPTFGEGGLVATAVPDTVLDTRELVLEPDDAILVAGVFSTPTSDGIVLARYLANGTPDASFGDDGIALVTLPADTATAVVHREPDGRLLVAAALVPEPFGFQLAFVRVLPDGTLDATFGTGGIIVHDLDHPAEMLSFQPDGSLLTTTVMDDALTYQLLRYRPDGTRDDGFRPPALTARPADALTDAHGKLVVASLIETSLRLRRFSADGTPDATFGDGGVVTTHPAGGIFPTRVLQQADGRIVVGGPTADDPTRFVLLRYLD